MEHRVIRSSSSLQGGPYYELLQSVLGAFACYRPDIGYVRLFSCSVTRAFPRTGICNTNSKIFRKMKTFRGKLASTFVQHTDHDWPNCSTPIQ